jgi:hypothetical protein
MTKARSSERGSTMPRRVFVGETAEDAGSKLIESGQVRPEQAAK